MNGKQNFSYSDFFKIQDCHVYNECSTHKHKAYDTDAHRHYNNN